MLRIRNNDETIIKIVIERTVGAEGLDDAIETIKAQVSDGLDALAKNLDRFNEAVLDSKGQLSCKNLLSEPEDAEDAQNDDPEVTKP